MTDYSYSERIAREREHAYEGTPTTNDEIGNKPLREVPWEEIRKQVKPDPKLGWDEQLGYWRQHAHEVWTNLRLGWTYYVLRSYQKDRSKEYARAFCLVDGWESELGDVYWNDITSHGKRVR